MSDVWSFVADVGAVFDDPPQTDNGRAAAVATILRAYQNCPTSVPGAVKPLHRACRAAFRYPTAFRRAESVLDVVGAGWLETRRRLEVEATK